MGNLSHTVGGTDNLVSFKSAARVPIDSLKVHFKPIQEGEGDPSPENVRPIRGWNEVEAYRIESDYIIEYIPGTTNSYNVTFVADGKGSVTATGTPTSYSICAYGIIDVEGTETIYATIYGTLNNITWNAPSLFNSNGDLISASLSDSILHTGLDLSQFPDVKKVRLILKRSNNGIEMNGGWCAAVIGKNRKITSNNLPITFPVIGKNLLDITKNNQLTSSNYTFSAGAINCVKVSASNASYVQFEQIFPAGTYTISCDYSGDGTVGPRFVCSKPIDGGTWNDYYQGYFKEFTERSCTFTTEEPFSPALVFLKRSDHYEESGTFYNIQLELGSEATAYESYNPDNTVYGGYIDLATGALMQTWGSLDLGSISWETQSYEGAKWFRAFLPIGVWQNTWYPNVTSSLNNHLPHFFIDRFKIVAGSAIYYGTAGDNVVGMDWRSSIRIKCDLYGQDAEAFQAAMNGVMLYYEYLTPVQVAVISPINCKTLLGQNNIWSNTNDITELSYAVHDTAPIRAAKKRIMMASPHLETVSDDLVNFNTDVAAPLKECKVEFKPKQDLHGYDSPWVGGAGKNLFAVKDAIGVRPDAAYGLTVTINSDESITISGTPTWTDINAAKTFRVLSVQSGIYYGDAPVSHDYTGLNLKWFVISKSNNISLANATGGISSDGTLTVSMTNTDLNEINVVLRGLICENASSETSWSPYENICPIDGWNSLEMYKTSKSIVPFLANPFSFSYQDYYNGSSGWSNIINSDELPTGAQLIYSAYLNCTNAVVSGENCVKIWIMQSNGKYRYAEGNIIQTGNSGMSYISTNVRDTDVSFEFGLGIRKGTIASNPMVEINNAPSNFEPYNGTTIPITFPSEVGTIYGGYVDLVNGEIVQEWELASAKWGDIKIGNPNSTTGYYYGHLPTINTPKQIVAGNSYGADIICNCIDRVLWEGTEYTPIHIYAPGAPNNRINVVGNFDDDQIIQVAFKIATPMHYPIDPQTLKTLRGTNNIWSNSNGPITIKYWKH